MQYESENPENQLKSKKYKLLLTSSIYSCPCSSCPYIKLSKNSLISSNTSTTVLDQIHIAPAVNDFPPHCLPC